MTTRRIYAFPVRQVRSRAWKGPEIQEMGRAGLRVPGPARVTAPLRESRDLSTANGSGTMSGMNGSASFSKSALPLLRGVWSIAPMRRGSAGGAPMPASCASRRGIPAVSGGLADGSGPHAPFAPDRPDGPVYPPLRRSQTLPASVRKWESRSRSCPRRFSAGHSNHDWSENATQWRQISSGISVTRRGMVAGAGRLRAWTASKPDGYSRGVRYGCWNGPTARADHWILRFAQAGMAGPARGAGRGSNAPARSVRHAVRSGGRRFWAPDPSSAAYGRIVVNNCGVYGGRQLSDSCRRPVVKRARIRML